MRYRLRTLLIVLALGPPLIAGAWWALDAFGPTRDPWYIDRAKNYVLPPNTPGHHWKLTDNGLIEESDAVWESAKSPPDENRLPLPAE